MRTSARNHFAGQITEVKAGAVNDEVTLQSQDGLEIVADITHGSTASLDLAAGKLAFALMKASSVIVMVDVDSSKVSARNRIAGTVSSVTKGAVNSEVIIAAQTWRADRCHHHQRKCRPPGSCQRQGRRCNLQGFERDRRSGSVIVVTEV